MSRRTRGCRSRAALGSIVVAVACAAETPAEPRTPAENLEGRWYASVGGQRDCWTAFNFDFDVPAPGPDAQAAGNRFEVRRGRWTRNGVDTLPYQASIALDGGESRFTFWVEPDVRGALATAKRTRPDGVLMEGLLYNVNGGITTGYACVAHVYLIQR